jgi:hypothetical protein
MSAALDSFRVRFEFSGHFLQAPQGFNGFHFRGILLETHQIVHLLLLKQYLPAVAATILQIS